MSNDRLDPQPQTSDSPSTLPPVGPLAVAPIRFCGDCGAPWDPAWIQCPHCAQRRDLRQAASPDASYARDLSSVKSAVALYFALLTVSIVAIITVAAQGRLSANADIAFSIAFCGITMIWVVARWQQVRPLLSCPFPVLWLPAAVASSLFTYALACAAVAALKFIGLQDFHYCDTFTRDGYGYGVAILMICAQPAIFEELAFRGVIQSSLLELLRPIEALVVTACIFGILHLSIPSLPHLVILGLALGYLRMRTGSLYPGMLLHFYHNFLVVLSEIFRGSLPW